jgi:hypothetical protein
MMEGRFEFDAAEVLPLLDEARAAASREMTEAQRFVAAGVDLNAPPSEGWEGDVHEVKGDAPPGVWLMNDRGVYLRSNARSRPGARVAHARGYRADVPVGDDSICEFIGADQLAPMQAGDTLVIAVTENKLRLSLVRPDA